LDASSITAQKGKIEVWEYIKKEAVSVKSLERACWTNG
jgi:hypothetical protein